jgi:FkbM family methyltransferase
VSHRPVIRHPRATRIILMVKDLIYDVGMHVGDDTAYYLHKGFRVVAIEANPALVARASERFGREIADGRLKIVNVAIAEAPGALPFWLSERPDLSSFDRDLASKFGDPVHQIEVRCSRLEPIFEEHGVPSYLKIDIEGHDRICIDQLTPGDLPRYVSAEADGGAEILQMLRDRGYTHFKCINQHVFLPLELPPCREYRRFETVWDLLQSQNVFWRRARGFGAWRPMVRAIREAQPRAKARAGRSRGWSFSDYSSGPFGEDTPGRWQGFEEVCETYEYYTRLAREAYAEQRPGLFFVSDDKGGMWCDFHARRDG